MIINGLSTEGKESKTNVIQLAKKEKEQQVSHEQIKPTTQPTAVESSPIKHLNKTGNAEVFFDYTVLISDVNDRLLITGDLHIKNRGTIPLVNPVICLKANPVENIEINGQILPPELTDGLGVQGADGEVKG